MPRIEINEDRCKGCALCTDVCPHDLVKMADYFGPRGYRPSAYVDPEHKCIGCMFCGMMCPDAAITVYREPKKGG